MKSILLTLTVFTVCCGGARRQPPEKAAECYSVEGCRIMCESGDDAACRKWKEVRRR